jgi:hydrogenase nickel incorporation protein HypA/HybF
VHELELIEEVVSAVMKWSRGARVHAVRLLVGRQAAVSPFALRSCFDLCVIGTVLDGSRLTIVEAEGDELRLEEVEVT